MRYTSHEDAGRRLNSGILLVGGIPCFLQQVRGFMFQVTAVSGSDAKAVLALFPDRLVDVNSDDSPVDLTSPQLGYTNLIRDKASSVAFLTRLPSRRSKQALDAGCLATYSYGQYSQRATDGTSREIFGLCSQGFARTMMGEYPSLETARRLMENPLSDGCAFSRDMAIRRTGKGILVYDYLDQPVGVQVKSDLPMMRMFNKSKAYASVFEELGIQVQ